MNPSVKLKFAERYGSEPLIIHAPGRINLIGEHTDYNDGFVMPAAIHMGVQFAFAPSQAAETSIYSLKYDEAFRVDLSKPGKVAQPGWANYFLGILHQLNERGLKTGNFNCVFDGDLPTGAGLSSSAAMECGFVFGLNELFKLGLTRLEMIHMAQWAEHHYAGVKCGIMDQFSSMMGKENHAFMLDCRSLEYEYLPLSLGDYTLLLCDTNVKHALSSSEYNTRRNECQQGVAVIAQKYPEVKSLRDLTAAMLPEFKDELPGVIYNRCRFVVEENNRVVEAGKDLKRGDLVAFGKKMFAAHEGLSKLYEVSCEELDFLVELAKESNGILGARMIGGGFGGCTLNLIRGSVVPSLVKSAGLAYYNRFGVEMTHYAVSPGKGTSGVAGYRSNSLNDYIDWVGVKSIYRITMQGRIYTTYIMKKALHLQSFLSGWPDSN
ncbi:MAG: galactokinase [Cyclobacteriaceae bacterium]|nr:galactokinase [Cyclobacteriaceae bacterium]